MAQSIGRRSIILPQYAGQTFSVYTNQRRVDVRVREDMIGQEFRAVVSGRARVASRGWESASACRTIERRRRRGPRARAMLAGLAIAEEDLRRSGGTYDLDQVLRLLHGAPRESVEVLVREGRLLSVPGPIGEARFPVAQFKDDGSVVEGLRETQSALPTKNSFAVLNFLVSADARLGGRRPIDLLVNGEVDLVVEAARRLGEQGA